jgi:metal-sulfur cluster biosynthetic enzyme
MTTMKAVVTAEDVIEELTRVYDPEIGIDIVNLGLIYEVAVEDETARVWMTFTTRGCPVGPSILDDVRNALESLPLIKQVEITLVWDPPWDLSRMSPQAKAELGIADPFLNES